MEPAPNLRHVSRRRTWLLLSALPPSRLSLSTSSASRPRGGHTSVPNPRARVHTSPLPLPCGSRGADLRVLQHVIAKSHTPLSAARRAGRQGPARPQVQVPGLPRGPQAEAAGLGVARELHPGAPVTDQSHQMSPWCLPLLGFVTSHADWTPNNS